jgi:hypothetical protein
VRDSGIEVTIRAKDGSAERLRSFSNVRNRRSAERRLAASTAHKLFLQYTVIGLALIGTHAKG